MILIENQIITKVISNLQKDFDHIKNSVSNKPELKKEYTNLFIDYRELLGKQVWLESGDFEFEKELVFEFIDLEKDVKNLIKKLTNENK